MSADGTYLKEIKLQQDEIPASINLRTGKVTPIHGKKYVNNIPTTSVMYNPEPFFKKRFENSFRFLKKYLTAEEFVVVDTLADRALISNNSLQPFNDSTPMTELAEVFGMSRKHMKIMLDKLLKLGVYGKFETPIKNKPYTYYWVFNPCLSFAGSTMKVNVINLFENSYCQMASADQDYVLTDEEMIELDIKPSTIKRRKNPND